MAAYEDVDPRVDGEPATRTNPRRGRLYPTRLITDHLDAAAAATPDKVAAIDARGQTTWARLKLLADRAALGLLELGIGPGDVVSCQLPNWTEFLVLHYAVSRIGAVHNPLPTSYRDRELGYLVELARPKLIVVPQSFDGHDHAEMVERLRDDWPELRHVLVVDGFSTHSQIGWREFLGTPWEHDRDPAELAALRPEPDDVTLLAFTSGTTGRPKGVLHTHESLAAANASLPARLGLDADSVVHTASTFAHLTGLLYGVRLPAQLGGATGVYQDVWAPARFVALVERHRVTNTSGATPLLHDTLAAPGMAEYDLTSLRGFCCLGAPIPRAVVHEAKRKLPRMAVLGGWGQSESALVTLGIPGDQEAKTVERDGFPLPGMRIRVVDADGTVLVPGRQGRLQVRGPSLFTGYWARPDLNRSCSRDPWFDTGDVAVIDTDGYLSIVGRARDVIVRDGEHIPVAHVENVLYEHPSIASVAVIGLPDPRRQESACAAVTLKPGVAGITLAEVTAFLAERGVACRHWPERLVVFTKLPRTPGGRIQKFRIRDRLWETAPV